MKQYKCIKSFCVDEYDGAGFLIENSSTVIEEGKVYELDKSGRMLIPNKDIWEECWEEMSYAGTERAQLYTGSDVFLWEIEKISD